MTIINRPLSDLENVLDNLEVSHHQFHLCGSRRYGNPRVDSDWDFFASHDVIPYLESIQFTKVPHHPYNDLNCDIVMRHPAGVDVQIRKDVDLYERCCQFLESHPQFAKHFGNHQPLRSVFWNILLTCLKTPVA